MSLQRGSGQGWDDCGLLFVEIEAIEFGGKSSSGGEVEKRPEKCGNVKVDGYGEEV